MASLPLCSAFSPYWSCHGRWFGGVWYSGWFWSLRTHARFWDAALLFRAVNTYCLFACLTTGSFARVPKALILAIASAGSRVVCRMRAGVMMDMRRHHHRFLHRGRRCSRVRSPLRPQGLWYRLLHRPRRSGTIRILRMNREGHMLSRPSGCQEVCRHFVISARCRGDSSPVCWSLRLMRRWFAWPGVLVRDCSPSLVRGSVYYLVCAVLLPSRAGYKYGALWFLAPWFCCRRPGRGRNTGLSWVVLQGSDSLRPALPGADEVSFSLAWVHRAGC